MRALRSRRRGLAPLALLLALAALLGGVDLHAFGPEGESAHGAGESYLETCALGESGAQHLETAHRVHREPCSSCVLRVHTTGGDPVGAPRSPLDLPVRSLAAETVRIVAATGDASRSPRGPPV